VRKAAIALLTILTVFFGATRLRAADSLQPINVSYQPTNYWALPFYLATEKNWWQEVGLNPTFSTFPAGAPQVAAAASGSWDVGSTGSVPAVLGAARYNILTIGISNDESATNVLMARTDKLAQYRKDASSIKGQQILLTASSTGEYAVVACLKKFGLDESAVQPVNLGQAQILSAFAGGTGNLAGLWAPYSYTLEDKSNAQVLCSGKDAGVVIPGALVVRAAYAKEHPDMVAKFLAVYEHAVRWEKAHPQEAQQALVAADKAGGQDITLDFARQEMTKRPIFDLAEQLKIMGGSSSDVDRWFHGIVGFMMDKGSIQTAPDPTTFITDEYMKLVDKDPKLRAFANSSN